MRRKQTRKAGGGLKMGMLTWVGLAMVVLGWVALLADILVSDATLRAGSLVATMALRADVMSIAQTAILSGLGLAIIGALRSGFGAFNRFFEAVLQRSSTPRGSAPAPTPTAEHVDPEHVSSSGPSAPHVVIPMERTSPPAPPPPLHGRERKNYVVLSDGSVEVETMFGTRVFATLDEARDFIR